ncbi:MAG: hypothetical protein WBY94_20355 [Polyangiaceae bacterium]
MSNIAAITYDGAVAVTKSDTVDDPNAGAAGFAGLMVTATGTVSFQDGLGNTVVTGTITPTAAPPIIPVRCVRVNATGTTATVYGLRAVP